MSMWKCLEICIVIFNSLFSAASGIVDWLDEMSVFGVTNGEVLFGAGLPIVISLAVGKFLKGILPGG